MTAAHTEAAPTISAILREQTTGDHASAERSPFLGALMQGALPIDGYIDMLAQHRHLYAVLEGPLPDLRADPVVAPFLDPALDRLQALDADLEELAGPDWAERFGASPATEAYADRVQEVAAAWPAGYIAHHYTRYLGDLSGGVIIGRIAAGHYDLGPGRGGRFGVFEGIADATEFKDRYRAALDSAPWDEAECRRVVEEIHAAYRYNGEVFLALERHVPA